MKKRLILLFLLLSIAIFSRYSLAQGSGYNAYQSSSFTAVGTAATITENTTILYHQVSWVTTGSPASCNFAVDSSADGSSWSAGGIISSTACTATSGSSTIASANAKYVRVNLTALSVGGSIQLFYKGWAYNPSGGGGGGTVGPGSVGYVPSFITTTTIGDTSPPFDCGTTTPSTCTAAASGGLALPNGPLTGGAGSAGLGTATTGFSMTEGTTSGMGSASQDACAPDSTAHAFVCNFNNDGTYPLVRTITRGLTAATGAGSINNLGSISTASCATLTVSATGVAATDVIGFSPNAAIGSLTGFTPATTGGLTINAYPTAGNVNFEVCNWTSGSVTPGQIRLNWRVSR